MHTAHYLSSPRSYQMNDSVGAQDDVCVVFVVRAKEKTAVKILSYHKTSAGLRTFYYLDLVLEQVIHCRCLLFFPSSLRLKRIMARIASTYLWRELCRSAIRMSLLATACPDREARKRDAHVGLMVFLSAINQTPSALRHSKSYCISRDNCTWRQVVHMKWVLPKSLRFDR